jgi:Protein of unknown function (DUF3300)
MRLFILLFCAALSFLPGQAQAQMQQSYSQAELDALLAPIALYPDDVVQLVLDAAIAPSEVEEAAQWSRANRGMTGEDAVRAAQGYSWQPSVKALVAYPDLLERMAQSPRWTLDLGNAWVAQQGAVMSTVQALRQRAYASGTLRSDAYQTVQSSAQGIAVVPSMPYIYCVPYYDPLVVYGGWWWPAYRPVHWRPWRASPVFVANVVVVNRGGRTHAFAHHSAQRNGSQAYHRVPESQRQPIVQSRGQPFVQSRGQPFVQSRLASALPQHPVQRPASTAQHQHPGPRSSGGGSKPHPQHSRGRS